MLLSSQLFDRIVGISDEPGKQAAVLPVGCRRAPERRKVSRLAFGQRTQICRDRGAKAGTWETVMVKDISAKGIGFVCNETIDQGATFMLKLTDKDNHTIRIRCRAERCEPGGFGGVAFLLGATFQQVILQQQLNVNDSEEDEEPTWHDDPAPAQQRHQPAVGEAAGFKSMGTAMARAVRSASMWMRRADDFSSV